MTARAAVYRHEAFPYAGRDEFVRSSADFLRGGLENDERAVLVALPAKIADVREALGDDARSVAFVDMGNVGRNPARIISVFQRFIAADRSGRRVRGLGEPVYPERTPAALAEAHLHELLLNAEMLQDWDFWLGCPYDVAALDDGALDAMRMSHPIVAGSAEDACQAAELAAATFAAPLSPPPADRLTYRSEGYDLTSVRNFIRTAAVAAGLTGNRLEDLVCAVNEAVTNSICHGGGAATVSVWRRDASLISDVRDGGVITDVLAGRLEPGASSTGGRGLWLVNQLCDLVQLRSSTAGTSVRMYMDI